MNYVFNKAGEPIEFMEYARLLQDNSYRVIDWTGFPDESYVSTIWLGIDHGSPSGPPLIFETMHFPSHVCWRFSTELEAKIGHKKVVEALQLQLQKKLEDNGEPDEES